MKVIVTGGCGFIGCNAAYRYLKDGADVIIYDNLSRRGSWDNLEWLGTLDKKPIFIKGDVRDFEQVKWMFGSHMDADFVLHLAGQVAVTRSVIEPREDFEINALGTLNILESIRTLGIKPFLLYTSTNKVYGNLDYVQIKEEKTRYVCPERPHGVSESEIVDFYSPYGCSKGAAEQYVRDYSRIYDLSTTVLRQSCIYGPRQLGVEDQGWLAWFAIAAILGRPITIYGNGKQVRDVLHVDDLIDCFDTCFSKAEVSRGKIYNVGGGTAFSISIWLEFYPILREFLRTNVDVSHGDWRPGDQKWYVSDTRKITKELGWKPKISPTQGIQSLFQWVRGNKTLLETLFGDQSLSTETARSFAS